MSYAYKRPRPQHRGVEKKLPERKAKKPSPDDFRIVDNFIDSVAPESESKSNPDIKKARRAWGRILLSCGE